MSSAWTRCSACSRAGCTTVEMNEELLTDTESGDAASDQTAEVAPPPETERPAAAVAPAVSDDIAEADDTVDATFDLSDDTEATGDDEAPAEEEVVDEPRKAPGARDGD